MWNAVLVEEDFSLREELNACVEDEQDEDESRWDAEDPGRVVDFVGKQPDVAIAVNQRSEEHHDDREAHGDRGRIIVVEMHDHAEEPRTHKNCDNKNFANISLVEIIRFWERNI